MNPQIQRMRKKRERSNLILLSIVLLFIVCQGIRIFFKAFEIIYIDTHVSAEVYDFCDR